MYSIDLRDHVLALPDVPPPSGGAPLPLILATEGRLVLAYLVEVFDPAWDGTTVRVVNHGTPGEPAALIEFIGPRAHFFGPPNDEAFAGHPLAARGLAPYTPALVGDSSWVRGLERMNRVHPYHRPEAYARLQHFIFPFHDSTFECVAEGLRVLERVTPLADLLPEMQRRVGLREAAT
jgi:hypothetical protein